MAHKGSDLSDLLGKELRAAKGTNAAIDAVCALWAAECPDITIEKPRINKVKALLLIVRDPGKRYLADLRLRAGMRARILELAKGTFIAVRIIHSENI